MRTQWTGCGTALVTPFDKDGKVDEAGVRRLARRQIDAGIHFLVPCGTTGETPTLSAGERRRVVELVLEAANGQVPVMAGAGGLIAAVERRLPERTMLATLAAQGFIAVGFYAFLRFHVDTTKYRRWGADPNVASCPPIIRPMDVASWVPCSLASASAGVRYGSSFRRISIEPSMSRRLIASCQLSMSCRLCAVRRCFRRTRPRARVAVLARRRQVVPVRTERTVPRRPALRRPHLRRPRRPTSRRRMPTAAAPRPRAAWRGSEFESQPAHGPCVCGCHRGAPAAAAGNTRPRSKIRCRCRLVFLVPAMPRILEYTWKRHLQVAARERLDLPVNRQ